MNGPNPRKGEMEPSDFAVTQSDPGGMTFGQKAMVGARRERRVTRALFAHPCRYRPLAPPNPQETLDRRGPEYAEGRT